LIVASRMPVPTLQWLGFLVGIVLFSGSLYLLALTQLHWLVYITPMGGGSFIVGWTCMLLKPPG
jgi:uncharacterized membrane protein YgdD (TMEM256/DUF423 family)